MRAAAIALLTVFLFGCGGSEPWRPRADDVLDAARDAAIEPATWLPAAAALAIGVAGVDDDIADWASDETPLFGSRKSALQASDHLRDGLIAGMALTSLLAPVNREYREFPGRRLAANGLAYWSAVWTADGLKETVSRERPDGSNRRSFPSGHTIKAFTSATLMRKNLNPSIDSPVAGTGLDVAATAAAAATAWARLEGEKHFPVDVLASAALGNFFAEVFHRSLVADEGAQRSSLQVSPEAGGGLSFRLVRAF